MIVMSHPQLKYVFTCIGKGLDLISIPISITTTRFIESPYTLVCLTLQSLAEIYEPMARLVGGM